MDSNYVDLVKKIQHYDPGVDEALIARACLFSMKSHEAQQRASGEPYFTHPLKVAHILADMKLDSASIITGLLHDVIEDTSITLDEIRQAFGEEIAFLVNGVTKLTRIELQSDQTKQADNFRKLFLAMSSDLRVLLVKLADRLHNMQTLCYIPFAEKRRKKALETMEIFVPLAERIGMQKMKNELEDLSFQELYAEGRQSIVKKLSFFQKEEKSLINFVIEDLKTCLKAYNISFTILGREKTPYSIWCKMVKKNIDFDQLSDIMAFRIIVEDKAHLYTILGILHQHYPAIPGRFKDYISTPKPNGYQSLHTTIIGPQQHRIEIQIRTQEMDYIAELGVAAHGDYKDNSSLVEKKHYRWLRGILDILEHSSGPEEFLEHTKLEMFQDQVFCFSLKGDIIALPSGATPIDFAYALQSEMGDHCMGAKVNGQNVPLKTILKNGDQIEIITALTQHPLPTWENYAVTGKARARVRDYIRSSAYKEHIASGRALLRKVLQAQGYVYEENQFKKILKPLGLLNLDDLYIALSNGHIRALDLIYNLDTASSVQKFLNKKKILNHKKVELPIKGLEKGMVVHLEECCWPLPGDRILGYVIPKKAVYVHTIYCKKTIKGFKDQPPIALSWTEFAESWGKYTVRINVIVENQPGSLGKIATEIGAHQGNIVYLNIKESSVHFFKIVFNIEIKDINHLEKISSALKSLEGVKKVERVLC